MIRLAIVGIGGYGHTLIQTIQELSADGSCKLIAAADNRLANLSDNANELSRGGVEIFSDALEMFDKLKGKCDAVCIAAGIASHTPLTIAAVESGYHVHLEKPPAVTVQEIDLMLKAVRRNQRMCAVGFHLTYIPGIQLLKERIASGKLGQVKTLTCLAGWPRAASYYGRNNWAGKLRSGKTWVLDGPATNALAHQINNMLYAASTDRNGYATPVSVRAEMYAAGHVESHNTAFIEIKTSQGPVVRWLGSHCSREHFGPVIRIDATEGKAVWNIARDLEITYADGSREQSHDGDSRREMIATLVAAVSNNDPSLLRCRLADTKPFVLALDGAHESSGCIHRIDDSFVQYVESGGPKERVVINDLDELLAETAEKNCLPSDLDNAPPWAVRTEAFDLSGYTSFPQKFSAD